MSTYLMLLIVLLVLLDVGVLAWILIKLPQWSARGKKRQEEWQQRLSTDQRLSALYDAHKKAWWRTGLAGLVDLGLTMGAELVLLFLLRPALAFFAPSVGVETFSNIFTVVFLIVWIVLYIGLYVAACRWRGITPGLHLLNIVAISPEGGQPASRKEFRPPDKGDYRRDVPPKLFYVPRRDLDWIDLRFPPFSPSGEDKSASGR